MKPIHEDFAELLLKDNKIEEAKSMFDRSLKRNPQRLHSLLGKHKVTLLLSDNEASKELALTLKQIKEEKDRVEIL